MKIWPFSKLNQHLVAWLMKEHEPDEIPVSDTDRVIYEAKPGDVLLVEGRSRISEVIKITTRSNWSHSAIYIGRLDDIEDTIARNVVKKHYKGSPKDPLLIEAILGKGIIVTPMKSYTKDHLRICRPTGIAAEDLQKVINYCVHRLGEPYYLRRVIDLLRLLFPVTFMPRYLFTSLLNPIKARHEHRDICSSLIAKAFGSVKYPILPKPIKAKDGTIQLIPRNPALFTPKDFDYSPYFTIIKYPLFGFSKEAAYKNFPWNKDGLISNDDAGIFNPNDLAE